MGVIPISRQQKGVTHSISLRPVLEIQVLVGVRSTDTTGSFNTGVGGGALALNNADSNTAIGAAALLLNTTGDNNTAVGTDALVHNDSGTSNVAIGDEALDNNVSGLS